ncbi:hypothetical protein MRX96_020555 [Rhipicephalus microplus]
MCHRSRVDHRRHAAVTEQVPRTSSPWLGASLLGARCRLRSAQRAPSDVQESRQPRDSNDVPRRRERNLRPTLPVNVALRQPPNHCLFLLARRRSVERNAPFLPFHLTLLASRHGFSYVTWRPWRSHQRADCCSRDALVRADEAAPLEHFAYRMALRPFSPNALVSYDVDNCHFLGRRVKADSLRRVGAMPITYTLIEHYWLGRSIDKELEAKQVGSSEPVQEAEAEDRDDGSSVTSRLTSVSRQDADTVVGPASITGSIGRIESLEQKTEQLEASVAALPHSNYVGSPRVLSGHVHGSLNASTSRNCGAGL